MKAEYWYNLFTQIITNGMQNTNDIFPWFEDFPKYNDYRGIIEIIVSSIRQTIYIIENIEEKGWVASNINIENRNLIGVNFDSKGDDFEGIRVLIPYEVLKKWYHRYNDGKTLSETPKLKEAIDQVFDENNNKSFLEKLKSANKVDIELYRNKMNGH